MANEPDGQYLVMVNKIVNADDGTEVPEGTFSGEAVMGMIQRASGENIEEDKDAEFPGNNYIAHCLGYDIYFNVSNG